MGGGRAAWLCLCSSPCCSGWTVAHFVVIIGPQYESVVAVTIRTIGHIRAEFRTLTDSLCLPRPDGWSAGAPPPAPCAHLALGAQPASGGSGDESWTIVQVSRVSFQVVSWPRSSPGNLSRWVGCERGSRLPSLWLWPSLMSSPSPGPAGSPVLLIGSQAAASQWRWHTGRKTGCDNRKTVPCIWPPQGFASFLGKEEACKPRGCPGCWGWVQAMGGQSLLSHFPPPGHCTHLLRGSFLSQKPPMSPFPEYVRFFSWCSGPWRPWPDSPHHSLLHLLPPHSCFIPFSCSSLLKTHFKLPLLPWLLGLWTWLSQPVAKCGSYLPPRLGCGWGHLWLPQWSSRNSSLTHQQHSRVYYSLLLETLYLLGRLLLWVFSY